MVHRARTKEAVDIECPDLLWTVIVVREGVAHDVAVNDELRGQHRNVTVAANGANQATASKTYLVLRTLCDPHSRPPWPALMRLDFTLSLWPPRLEVWPVEEQYPSG